MQRARQVLGWVVLALAMALVVAGGAVGARMLLSESADRGDETTVAGVPSPGCSAQPDRGRARMARERFLRTVARPRTAAWLDGVGLRTVERITELPAASDLSSGALPSGSGWAVVVLFNPAADLPEALPSCAVSTPYVYLPSPDGAGGTGGTGGTGEDAG